MIKDDQILEFLIDLEHIKKVFESYSDEGSSNMFNIEHDKDIIKIEESWSTYEEGGASDYIIHLGNPIKIQFVEDVHSVHGDYDNKSETICQTLDETLQYFNKRYLD